MPDYRAAVLSSGKVNRYGYRLLIEGAKLDSFKANPLMLYVHKRSAKYDSFEEIALPIGKWTNIRIEDGKLLADPDFDLEDEFAAKVARKWEKGYLNATSVNHTFDEISEDEALRLEGQTRVTVTSWEVLEASIVDIPGDAEAVKLNFEGGNDPLSKLPFLSNKSKSETMDLKFLALSLGLPEKATEAEIMAKAKALQNTQVEAVLSLGRQKGVVNDTNIDNWRKQVEANLDFARLSWEALPDVQTQKQTQGTLTLADVLRTQGGKQEGTLSDERKSWTIDEWRKNDAEGFLSLETKSPETYNKLVNSLIKTGLAMPHFDDEKAK